MSRRKESSSNDEKIRIEIESIRNECGGGEGVLLV